MTSPEPESGASRDELLQRIALVETMIAEGRRSTARCGWIFVLWGLVDIAGVGWEKVQSNFDWIWPITLATGLAIQFLVMALRGGAGTVGRRSVQNRNIAAVWSMMGLTVILYVFAGLFQHKAWQISYIVAILMFVGMAHAISALILRWPVQGAVAVLWWAGGIGMYFIGGDYFLAIFVAEMFFGMVLFGLYAMWLDGRERQGRANANG